MGASAVKGLRPEKVVLLDYRGKILSRNEGPESGLSAQQLDARQRVETELAGKIVQILEPAVGQGKIRPQVSVVMNFEQVEDRGTVRSATQCRSKRTKAARAPTEGGTRRRYPRPAQHSQ